MGKTKIQYPELNWKIYIRWYIKGYMAYAPIEAYNPPITQFCVMRLLVLKNAFPKKKKKINTRNFMWYIYRERERDTWRLAYPPIKAYNPALNFSNPGLWDHLLQNSPEKTKTIQYPKGQNLFIRKMAYPPIQASPRPPFLVVSVQFWLRLLLAWPVGVIYVYTEFSGEWLLFNP